MCLFNLVLFALLCIQEALSGFPELVSFGRSKPQTWEQAGKEIATRPLKPTDVITQTVEEKDRHGRTIRKEVSKPSTHWGKAWWYASERMNEFQWRKAERALREKLTEIKTKVSRLEAIHGFVGIKLRIEGLPPTAEEAAGRIAAGRIAAGRIAAGRIAAGELPPGITLLWSNGNAEPKEIKLDVVEDPFPEQTNRLKGAIKASQRQILNLFQITGVEEIRNELKRLRDMKKELKRLKKLTRQKANAIDLQIDRFERSAEAKLDSLGLVMYIEGAGAGVDIDELPVQYKFIPVSRVFKPHHANPYRSMEPSFFFVQDIEQHEPPQSLTARKVLAPSNNQKQLEGLKEIEHHVKAYESGATGPAATASATSSKTGHGGSPLHRAVEEPSYERYPARNDPYDNYNYARDDMNVSVIVMVVTIYVLFLYCLCVCCSVIGMPAGCYLAEKVNVDVRICEV